jgi:hypothetical protein
MKWGDTTWIFLHTLSITIPEPQYTSIKDELLKHIKLLCKNLPCPTCAEHASQYMNNIRVPDTRDGFKHLLFTFHNSVNTRLGKPLFAFDQFEKYKTVNLTIAFHSCMKLIQTQPYNPRLSMNKVKTTTCLRNLHLWLGRNGLIYK